MPTKKGKNPETTVTPEEAAAVSGNGKEESAKVKANEPLLHLIVFKLGAEFYGIKIEQVKEVTVTPTITRMPRTPDFVKGVANIRGDIIAIMDLEERFGIRPDTTESAGNASYTLVIEAKEYSIGVVVKEVPQSLNLSVLDKTPSFLQDIAIQENYIEGIAKEDNRLIIVLDMYKILSGDEIKQLSN